VHPRSPSTAEQTRPLEDTQRAQASRYQPPTHERPPASQPPVTGSAYDRGESVQGFTVADTFSTALTCSGLPDSIWLLVRSNAVTIRLQDEMGRDPVSFDLSVGNPVETYQRRRVIQAQNVTPGAAGLLSVVAKYSYPLDTEMGRKEIAPVPTDGDPPTLDHPY
jgi:hypothetical protein